MWRTAVLAAVAALLTASDVQAQGAPVDRVAAIASIRSAVAPSFSPDGTRLAYISNASGAPQVWVAPAAGGEAVQTTKLADPVQGVAWSPSGDWLAYAVAPGGGLNVQVYVAKADGSEAKMVTAGGAVNNRLYGWSHDGRWLGIGTNRLNPTEMDAFLIDPATGESRAVGAGKGLDTIADVSADGRFAVISRLVSRGDNNLILVDLASGAETLLTPHSGTASFGWGEISPDGRRVFVISDVATDLAAFGTIEIDAAGKPLAFKVLARRSDAEADNAALSRDGARAALRWNVAGRSELAYLDTATGKLSPGPKLPGDVIGGPVFSNDGRSLALSLISAAAPTDVWVADTTTGKAVQVTHSRHDGVDLATLVRPTLVTYKAEDGLPLSGWLYRPAGAKGPGPVVFIYHGGPEGQSRPTLSTDVQALVARGISVFLPNVRGSTGFGKRFVNLDNGALRVNGVKDIKASTDALVAQGVADPKRLGIMGGSYGGYMVMAGITDTRICSLRRRSLRRGQFRDLLPAHPALDGGDLDGGIRRSGHPGRYAQGALADPQARPDQDPAHRPARRQRHQCAGNRGRADRPAAARPRRAGGIRPVPGRRPRLAAPAQPDPVDHHPGRLFSRSGSRRRARRTSRP